MQRMRSAIARTGLVLPMFLISGAWLPAHADLIRPRPGRAYPDIAGDIGGSQTYRYDPATRTGVFSLINTPHLISLGPADKDLVPMQPEKDGTLTQSLKMKLDGKGRLVESPGNMFEIRGSVVIGNEPYEGILLQGQPKAFGVANQESSTGKNPDIFDLKVEITGGKLAEQFGNEAYLRITPQAKSTFRGEFTSNFSGEKPRTNLRASKDLPTTVPEPTPLITLLTCGTGFLIYRLRRYFHRSSRRRGKSSDRPTSLWHSEKV